MMSRDDVQQDSFSVAEAVPPVVAFLNDLWAIKSAMVYGLLLGLCAAFAFISVSVPHYRATMVIAPSSAMQRLDTGGQRDLSQISTLIQSMGGDVSHEFQAFEARYAGVAVARELLKDTYIVESLKTARSFIWSQADKNIAEKPQLLAEYIRSHVRLSGMGLNSMRNMSYYHPDPDFAAYFIKQVHAVTDRLIRQEAREQSDKRVRYLQETLAKTLNPDHKRALTSLLLEQERLQMFLVIDTFYAASVIEPVSSSARRRWPDPVLVYGGGGVLGLLAGIVSGLIALAYRRIRVAELEQTLEMSDKKAFAGADEEVEAMFSTPDPKRAYEWYKRQAKNVNSEADDVFRPAHKPLTQKRKP